MPGHEQEMRKLGQEIRELEKSIQAMQERPWATMPGDCDAAHDQLNRLRSEVIEKTNAEYRRIRGLCVCEVNPFTGKLAGDHECPVPGHAELVSA